MQSRTNSSLPPHFHELDEYTFQKLCCDLLAEQSEISTCDEYGTRGQTQEGIDLIAYYEDDQSVIVGDSKCYEDFPPHKIREASNKFLNNLEFWEKELESYKIKKFILFVACDLSEKKRQQQIIKEKNKFQKHNIIFEVWSSVTLRQKLAPHRSIVSRYIRSQDIVDNICGRVLEQNIPAFNGSKQQELIFNILSSKLENISSDLSREKDEQLNKIRELYKEGNLTETYTLINELHQDKNWDIFEKPLQAKILRTLGSYEININDNIEKARTLASQAKGIDFDADDTIIQTLICYHTEGAKAALEKISNISNIDVFNLQLALLLESKQTDEIKSKLQEIPEGIQPNTETKRLEALVFLDQGNIDAAQTKIQQALYEKPKWEMVIFTSALINYYSALSPVIFSSPLSYSPEPIDWSLIKRDDASLKRLRKAQTQFEQLGQIHTKSENKNLDVDIWRLACLSNDPDSQHQNKAQELCNDLLNKDPSDPNAIIWAISRNYKIDIEKCKKALESSLEISDKELGKITVLLCIYLNTQQITQAIQLLDKTEEQFEQKNSINVWHFYYTQVLIANGQTQEALHKIEQLNSFPLNLILKTHALRQAARHSNNWEPFIEHLEQSFEETKNGVYLYEACELKAYLKDWAYIGNKADDLVELMKTPEALYLSAQATWEDKNYPKCLELLTNNVSLFSQKKLPSNLRSLRTGCQEKLGLITQSITEAEKLVQEQETTENLIRLINLQHRQGDIIGLVYTASLLYRREDISQIALLQTANLVLIQNKSLATKCWKKAVKNKVEPENLGLVLDLGWKLNLDHELSPFIQQMASLAAKGEYGFSMVDIKEMISVQEKWNKHSQTINQEYEQGRLPSYFLAEGIRISLVNLLHTLPDKNRSADSPHLVPAILSRYAGRPFPEISVDYCSQWRLHLDISALLLAAHIGILDLLEKHFKPLRISPNLQIALQHQYQMLQPNQPSALDNYRQILKLRQEKKIFEIHDKPNHEDISIELIDQKSLNVSPSLELVIEEDGYLVEFSPLQRMTENNELEIVNLSNDETERVINGRAIIETLKNEGKITKTEYKKMLSALGNEGQIPVISVLPPLGSKLFLSSSSIAKTLVREDVLKTICEYFKVYIDSNQIQEIEREINSSKDNESDGLEWLKSLIDRISEGLTQNIYEMIPCSSSPQHKELEDSLDHHNPDILTVLDLFQVTPEAGNVLWIDDRCLNKNSHFNVMPIISIIEILEALRVLEAIKINDYYDKLMALPTSWYKMYNQLQYLRWWVTTRIKTY
ncbi:hypothetical protein VB715_21040 [Crocosphaera sp. UHCC 0190]|uniref:HTH domain-containing protein n=1 Tax=Crocosphaera sp. UHCC 0190 TaxID=3110246 RepID=UPI002B206521|nr:hypothetical protein [Crocosphaera sp. UHCC 0190]MEA5512261.1 hypothetical protein [Crocosphaera sp. UHCC 0190]